MRVYQKEVLGIEHVSGTDSVFDYGEWAELKRALISKAEETQIKYMRWKRKFNEVRQRVESNSLRYSARV
jgi:hypothetical protein